MKQRGVRAAGPGTGGSETPAAKPRDGNVSGGSGTALLSRCFPGGSRVVPALQGWARPPFPHAVYPHTPAHAAGPQCAGAPVRRARSGAEGGGRARDSGNAAPAPRPRRTGHPAPTSQGCRAGLAVSGELGTGRVTGRGRLAPRAPGVRGLSCAPRSGRSRRRGQGRQIADFILLTLTRVPGRSWERPWSGIANTYGGGVPGEGPSCWGRAFLQNLPPSSALGSRSTEQARAGECAAQAAAAVFAFGLLEVVSLASGV